jgi:hypothetical protein
LDAAVSGESSPTVTILRGIRQTLGRLYRRFVAGTEALGPIKADTREQFPPEEFEHQQFSSEEFVAPEREESR